MICFLACVRICCCIAWTVFSFTYLRLHVTFQTSWSNRKRRADSNPTYLVWCGNVLGIHVDPETDDMSFYVKTIQNHGGPVKEWVEHTQDLFEQWIYQCDQNPHVDYFSDFPNSLYWGHQLDEVKSVNSIMRDKNGDWHGRIMAETFRICPKWVYKTFHLDFLNDCEEKTGSFCRCPEGMSTRSTHRKRQKTDVDAKIPEQAEEIEDKAVNEDYDVMPKIQYPQGNDFTCVNSSLASCMHYMGATNKKGEPIAKFVHDLKDVYSNRRIQQAVTGILQQGGWTVQYHKKPYNPLAQYEQWPTLVLFQDSKNCTRHCITIMRNMIFDSNKQEAMMLTKENLDSCSIHKGATFVKSICVVHFVPGPVVQKFLN
jgi:hypothetical protein